MTTATGDVPATRPSAPEALFVVTICAGSFLLFLVQPMVARMALPRLGGAPAVWNSAMLVYQALLLGGYGYAHLLGRLTSRRQAVVHLALFFAAALMLPIGLVDMAPAVGANPFLWVPWLFVTSIGPLFFMVSAQAPLLQRWFAAAGGVNPYRLYAASNLGSFGGLIAYPLLVEPLLPLQGQSWLWSAGYGTVLLLTGLCALRLRRTTDASRVRSTSTLPWRRIPHWIALSAIPSGLMLSTSTHLTTDIVAMPLLWVLPLGLYLLSFSVAFADDRKLANGISSLLPLLLLGGGCTAFVNTSNATILFALVGLILLFGVAVALHARLYDLRPEPEQLTAFYLAMSVGGVIGGLFCALVAPLVFDWVYEHPILIVAAALALAQRPLFGFAGRLWSGRHGLPAAIVLSLGVLMIGAFAPPLNGSLGLTFLLGLVVIWAALVAIGQRFVFAVCLIATMLTLGGRTTIGESLWKGTRSRSFFGVYDVVTDARPARMLVHGTTLHGTQSLAPGRTRDALSYYAPRSGVGMTLAHLPELYGPRARVGIVGLGAGTVACYAQPGQDWRFYEIDPAVELIARNPRFFTFLSGCLPGVPVKIGDARLVLAGEPAAGLDVLVVDAFSSDAVPMHLLTREAMAIYRRRLAPNGLLVMHISNRYLDLEPVLAAAQAQGWHGAMRHYWIDAAGKARGDASSFWAAMSPDPAKLVQLVQVSGAANWRPLRARPGFAGWTDDYASILPLITLTGQK